MTTVRIQPGGVGPIMQVASNTPAGSGTINTNPLLFPTLSASPMPSGLLGANPAQTRANAFLQGIGAMAPGLLMAGAPSTDPGNRDRGLALAFQGFQQAQQGALDRARTQNLQNLQFKQAQQSLAQAQTDRQNLMKFADNAVKAALATGDTNLAAMIKANPLAYMTNVYARQLEKEKAKVKTQPGIIGQYNFAKRQFVARGGNPDKFISFPEFMKTFKFAGAANPQIYTPPEGSGTMRMPAIRTVSPTGGKLGSVPTGGESRTVPITQQRPQSVTGGTIGTITPLPGSKAALEIEKKAEKQSGRQAQKVRAGTTVIQDLQRALGIVQSNYFATGIPAELTSDLPVVGKQTPAGEARALVESALSNVGLDTLQSMRENSPTGGALGQVPIQQQKRLEQVLGSLDVGQRAEVVEDNIKRVINIYLDIVYGNVDQIQKLVEQGKITATEAAPLMERHQLSFDEFGKPLEPVKPKITIKRIN